MMRRKFTDIVEFSGKACGDFDGMKSYISTGCVHEDHVCDDEIEIVNYHSKPSRANLIVGTGDILFAKMQATKKALFIDERLSKNIYSTGFCAVKPKDGIITQKCLYYLIISNLFLDEKDKNCSGATQKAINNHGLSLIELNIPEYSVQNSLTKKLDMLSEIITAKQDQIEHLDNLVKARFVEMFSIDFSNNVELGNVCDVRDGTHDSPKYCDEGYPLVTSKNICDGKIVFSTCNLIRKDDYDKINKRSKVDNGDILMPMIGTVGNPIIVDADKEFAIKNVALIKFKDDNKILNSFVKALLESDYFDRAVLSKTKGGTQKFISLGDIRKLEFNLPPIELQNQFAAFVAQVDKSKFALSNELTVCCLYIRLVHDCIAHGRVNL